MCGLLFQCSKTFVVGVYCDNGDNDPQSLGGDACRELEVLQASPRCQVPQGGDQSLLRSDGLPHAGTLPADIGGQQSQQMVKYGVRHLEKVPEIIRIILTDLTEQRHMTELVTLEQPILGP
ncbi:hypothetical protein AB205_0013430 [Aquarana catesbeiana]|uniref:Uncharacterized protein n=1 Tax=Aquarana catesbeiana TaxID=8400 RepID=A0A2G9Q9C0_AQUCT|nr:hypothetical protein AB205_0013430 [Aquarana catesbeiana]